MTSRLVCFLAILLVVSCNAQLLHRDKMEYGFKGNVKVVTKRVYPNPLIEGDSVSANTNEVNSIYIYFFNSEGNIDSAETEYAYPSGENFSYKTIFKFDSLRKTGWVAIDENGDKLLTGEVKWISDKEFIEKVFDASDVLKYETTSILNASFRVIKTKIKAFDGLGNAVQDDLQEFDLDKQQNIISYTTTHQADRQSERTDYKYLKMADMENPAELFMMKKQHNTKTFVRLEYVYY